jgi:hypothetical protein
MFWLIYLIAQCVDLYGYVLTFLVDGSLSHALPFVNFALSVSLSCHFFAEPQPEYQVFLIGLTFCPKALARGREQKIRVRIQKGFSWKNIYAGGNMY